MPESYKWQAFGIDWGYTNDPTAVVDVRFFDNKIWLDECLYERGLTNSDIAEARSETKKEEHIADSAEPKSIEDLRRHGFRIRPCSKGSDSIRSGIDKMQQFPIMVMSRSINIISELRKYTWAKDKNGEATGKPIDDHNHAIDSVRYVVMEKAKARSGQYSIR